MKLTVEEIEAGKTPNGGWTRAQLAKWGVPWPPPRGWRQSLLHGEPIPTHRCPYCGSPLNVAEEVRPEL